MMYIKEFLGGKYMKKYFIALSIMMLMLSACGHSNDRIDFSTSSITTPTSIKVNNGISEIYLTPEQLEFSEVVALIERNWWKTIKDINEPLTDANLKDMDAPIKILNTFSEKELSNQDILISFYYKEPIKWKNVINSSNEGDLFKIISYVFILDTTFSEENNKGIMLISEDENVFNKSNMYEYYYNKSLIPLIKGLFESNYSNE